MSSAILSFISQKADSSLTNFYINGFYIKNYTLATYILYAISSLVSEKSRNL